MFAGDGGAEALWSGERRSAADFRQARLEAFSGRLGRHLWRRMSGVPVCCEGCCEYLACFAEEAGSLQRNPGGREFDAVEVESIVGSVGRCRQFDGGFLPACTCTSDRWKRVDRAFVERKHLPPVELYKAGERHFVYDGNHRVSVARHHGAAAVDALITTFTAQ